MSEYNETIQYELDEELEQEYDDFDVSLEFVSTFAVCEEVSLSGNHNYRNQHRKADCKPCCEVTSPVKRGKNQNERDKA